MKFGIFDHMDRGTVPLGELYENRLRLAQAYDRAGFYAYHVAEHHSTPLGMAPSPGVFLAALAQRTQRLRFGPLVYPLPLYHPLRAMEEICMLDHLSGGRLEVGIGRGASPYELEYYAVDPAQSAAIYQETYAILIAALSSRTLTYAGKFHSFRDVPIEIEPLQRPHPPFWYGVVNTDGAAWAARNKINVVCNGPTDLVRSLSDCYRAAWLEAGNDIADLPLFGMNRYLVLAERDAEAMTIARRAYQHWHHAFYYLWEKRGGKPEHISALYPDTFDEAQRRGYAVAGTPQRVRDTLLEQTAAGRPNYLVCRFAFGDLTLDESLRSLDLFMGAVAPSFGHDAGTP